MRDMVAEGKTILIAGAGPVGLAAAVELTRRGLKVRIVDAEAGPTPDNQSRALAVLPTTLAILKPSGVADRMLAEGGRILGADFSRDGKPLFSFRIKGARTPTPFILSLPQARTERILIGWLEEHGVAVEWNVSVTEIGETHRPTATLSTGECLAADAVLGCDGAHSRVREAVGIPWKGEGYPGTFSLADVRFSVPIDAHHAKISLRSGGGGTALLPFGAHEARLIGLVDDPRTLLDGLQNVSGIVWTSKFHVAFRRAERMAKGRVYLAGDAAHVHSPVGGRGMNLGIWDAGTIAFLLSKGRESEYETRRLPVVDAVLKATRRMTDLVAHPPALVKYLMPLGFPLATRIPPIRRRVSERLLALDLPQPEWLES
ncbi:NAD(P)/FAD-dependent oxidoreductase [Aurantimonas sp. VKM B-3413]|uniref:FAD-dependent oxidoreductase n=1 Tax=Aurantimonas sp. VKM B-3413 TaxID=2779401 RepID=UPI001E49A44E|nr:NAD(P)/FAD-dependent oxidoreductase [Aurantimonas sp. VKM B-3413]MCB8837883.1 FAD-dependent monooxygenase [Aurantimonas sp. VKM B-3413]